MYELRVLFLIRVRRNVEYHQTDCALRPKPYLPVENKLHRTKAERRVVRVVRVNMNTR